MPAPPVSFRRPTPEDAEALADLVNIAGDGLPVHIWATLGEDGQTGIEVGVARARAGLGGFAPGNVFIREIDGRIAACLIGYPADGAPIPADADPPPLLRPLQELGEVAGRTWYLNALATFPAFRGRGLGGELLALADWAAGEAGHERISLTVSSVNASALRLYARHGYAEVARRPIVKAGWEHGGTDWLLLRKDLAEQK